MEAPKFHDFLTLKFKSFALAAEYCRLMDDRITDETGRPVLAIHKGAKASRLPDVQRRGQGLKDT